MTDGHILPPLGQAHHFLVRIDHVGIHADDPAALFRFFAKDLGLPIAFPFTTYPAYSSGCVSLGTMFLELMRFGRPCRGSGVQGRASYYILGFLVRPDSLPAAAADLNRRGIARSGILPVFAPDATGPYPDPLWENVYVGGLLQDTRWTRLFFALTEHVPPRPAAQRSALATTLLPPLLHRAFPSGIVVLPDYRSGNDDGKWATDRQALREREGDVLGVTGPAEVVVGVPRPAKTFESWERFLAPLRESADGLWRLSICWEV